MGTCPAITWVNTAVLAWPGGSLFICLASALAGGDPLSMQLRATDFQAAYRACRPFRLPHHSGSLLRGALGRALRRVACHAASLTASPPCAADCAEPRRCTYTRLFDPLPPEPSPHPFVRGQTRAPQPLLPLFPPPGARHLAPHDSLPFKIRLRLLGPTHPGDTDVLFTALEAFDVIPLGREGVCLRLESAAQIGPRAHRIGLDPPPSSTVHRVRITFDTPAWLERGDSLAVDLDFRFLFRSIYRRLTVLAALYGTPEPDDDARFQRLDALAAQVRTGATSLRRAGWKRRSTRRGTHEMQGLLGEISFDGPLTAFVPILRLAEAIHIGKATSFGLGRITVDAHGAPAPGGAA
ncbi:CRISPR system precrRNA processing endoribonuclease RAMP protein Cas6 [Sorangium sp. So ce296]|uniref:CRISPR system precrRNA processing endoribonuclease RAMP protein Cas6 n=1 Tax=Sorangium sp. So ce296 TaxID=3133296 RepID=UPI003F5DDEA4